MSPRLSNANAFLALAALSLLNVEAARALLLYIFEEVPNAPSKENVVEPSALNTTLPTCCTCITILSKEVSKDSASKRELLARSVSCLYSNILSNISSNPVTAVVAVSVNVTVADSLFPATRTV